jgi:hypothetical protein
MLVQSTLVAAIGSHFSLAIEEMTDVELTNPMPNFTYPAEADVEHVGFANADPSAVNFASHEFDEIALACPPAVLTFSAAPWVDADEATDALAPANLTDDALTDAIAVVDASAEIR